MSLHGFSTKIILRRVSSQREIIPEYLFLDISYASEKIAIIKHNRSLPLSTATTASTLAPYRASPIEHLHPASREQARDLPSFKMANAFDDGRQSLPALEPISRPSSTSTQNSIVHHSASLPQLPGLSALASLASTNNSPQLRYVGILEQVGLYWGACECRQLEWTLKGVRT